MYHDCSRHSSDRVTLGGAIPLVDIYFNVSWNFSDTMMRKGLCKGKYGMEHEGLIQSVKRRLTILTHLLVTDPERRLQKWKQTYHQSAPVFSGASQEANPTVLRPTLNVPETTSQAILLFRSITSLCNEHVIPVRR